MANSSSKRPSRPASRKPSQVVAPPSEAAPVSAAVIESAAQRAGWSLASGRAEQIAASAAPVVKLLEGVSQIIDFDSDPLAFAVVRDSVKYREVL